MQLPQEVKNIMLAWFGYPDEEVYCQVATVSKNHPHIRTMKLYDISEEGFFIMVTATSSHKWQSLLSNPALAFCLTAKQGQLTAEGAVQLLTYQDNQAIAEKYWAQLPAYWQNYYAQEKSSSAAIPETFGIIMFKPTLFDLLHINHTDYLKSDRQLYTTVNDSWLKKDLAPE